MKYLLFAFLLSGCSIFWGNPGRYDNLTPEQIDALKKSGQRVYSCSTVAGPPPAGRITFIVLPADAPAPQINFGSDCQVR